VRVVVGVVIAALFLAAMFFVTASETTFECSVCIQYGGGENCATVAGPDEQQTLMQAVTTACAPLSSGVTDGMECNRSRPKSVRCTQS
jgi:hypothetical protein